MAAASIRVISVIILVCCTTFSHGQYTMRQPVYTYPGKIPLGVSLPKKIMFKGVGGHVFLYIRNEDKPVDSVSFSVNKIDVRTRKIVNSFPLPKIPAGFDVTDIIPGDRSTIFLDDGKVLYYRDNKEAVLISKKGAHYNRGLRLNDSLVLLYEIYDFHPNNGGSGLHMHLLNLRNFDIVKSVVYRFPGVAMGAMNINWLTNDHRFIYAFAGLSGRVFKYDFDLKQVSEKNIPIFSDTTYSKNRTFEYYNDSIIAAERLTLKEALAYTRAYNDTAKDKIAVRSEVYSKDFTQRFIDKVRSDYCFIDKVFKLDDAQVLLTVCRPGYARTFVDVYLYNLKTNTVREKYKRWRIKRAEILEKPEDYFPVYVTNDIVTAPYFYRGDVYYLNLYDITLFHPGPLEKMEELYHKQILENGYKWQLIKYSL